MNASEMLKALKERDLCAGLDVWLREELFTKLAATSAHRAIIDYGLIHRHGWTTAGFTAAMRARGYVVAYECDDRPCSSPYYKISLPRGE